MTPRPDSTSTLGLVERLEHLRELSAQATPGPWFSTNAEDSPRGSSWDDEFPLSANHSDDRKSFTLSTDPARPGWEHDGGIERYGLSLVNAEFAAAAINFVRDLLADEPAAAALRARLTEGRTLDKGDRNYALHDMPAFHEALAGLKCQPGQPAARLCTLQFAAKMIELVDASTRSVEREREGETS